MKLGKPTEKWVIEVTYPDGTTDWECGCSPSHPNGLLTKKDAEEYKKLHRIKGIVKKIITQTVELTAS